ncbi:glyoxalase [Devosia epidermidihirudinis]|uniref:Glyoxalase n=1 Tax=Devosia epidermidihirudinis TaxID=1293439 RepID=A0A0F5QER6_9HYPH|nr:VOC family protein [Devosia epidermidihirudinis]KKC39450.1 glyoxalase [Devosia epidermidihirudinis]
MSMNAIEVITLFADDIVATKAFYKKVFAAEVLFEDDVSAVFQFAGVMINLLKASEAPELVTPAPVGTATSGARMMLTIRVEDVNATYADLQGRGVSFLNGPIDRSWGRRTATFADPAGHAWEIAQEI